MQSNRSKPSTRGGRGHTTPDRGGRGRRGDTRPPNPHASPGQPTPSTSYSSSSPSAAAAATHGRSPSQAGHGRGRGRGAAPAGGGGRGCDGLSPHPGRGPPRAASSTYRASIEADMQLLYVTKDPKMATVWEVSTPLHYYSHGTAEGGAVVLPIAPQLERQSVPHMQ